MKILTTRDETSDDIAMLDILIGIAFCSLKETIETNPIPRIGDFTKMIELRRKLSPQDAAVRKLWDIVEQVRKEVLAGDKPLKICAGDDKK